MQWGRNPPCFHKFQFMLYDNFEPFIIPETGDVSREELKKQFPDFYEGKPVKLNAMEDRYRFEEKVKENRPTKVVMKAKKAPSSVGHKAIFHVKINGRPMALQYSQVGPESGQWGRRFPGGLQKLNIGERFQVAPHQEDLLFGLYFGAKYIANGASPDRSARPLYEFARPALKAQHTIQNWEKDNSVKKQVYHDLSQETVERVMKALGIPLGETLTNSRVTLADAVIKAQKTGNETFVNLFNDLVNSKPTGIGLADMSEIVNELFEEEKIKEVTGGYVSKSKTKVGEWNKTPFWTTSLKGDEARLALIDHLKENSQLLSKISQ